MLCFLEQIIFSLWSYLLTYKLKGVACKAKESHIPWLCIQILIGLVAKGKSNPGEERKNCYRLLSDSCKGSELRGDGMSSTCPQKSLGLERIIPEPWEDNAGCPSCPHPLGICIFSFPLTCMVKGSESGLQIRAVGRGGWMAGCLDSNYLYPLYFSVKFPWCYNSRNVDEVPSATWVHSRDPVISTGSRERGAWNRL